MKRSILALFLGLVILGPLPVSAAQPVRSDEGFLILLLLRARTQVERIRAEIETGEKEIATNRQVIATAEKKLQIAMETRNSQASIIPANDLRRARAAKRELAKAQSLRKEALTRAEENAATLRGMIAGGSPAGPGRPVLAMATPITESASVLGKGGAKVALKDGRAGFLIAGDAISSAGASHVEVQALDGRAILQMHGGSEIRIEEDGPQSQTLRLAQGQLSAVVETLADLDRTVNERLQAPDDDLTPLLRRYRTGMGNAGPVERVLRIRVPYADCAVTAARFDIELKEGGTAVVVVSEGTVEVSDLKGEKRVAVEAGYEVAVTKDGPSAPRKRTP